MLKKRIIPCLDIKDGQTVKGTQFVDIRLAGDPIALAQRYVEEGADELVFLDITATVDRRQTLLALVSDIARHINIPFTVGGGIRTADDAARVIEAGADKISINSAAVRNPQLISDIARRFGNQCVVLAIDTRNEAGRWSVYVDGGRTPTGLDTISWAQSAEQAGAGEILLTAMNNDGEKKGFALDITAAVSEAVNIPVIASGGAGNMAHFVEVFSQTGASAALAASIFHFEEVAIPALKQYLEQQHIPVRVNQ